MQHDNELDSKSPSSEGDSGARLQDGIAGVVVFLVALPLCLGIAVASNAPPLAGLLAGVIGGVVVGWLSGSHTSVSGPAAGLTAVVLAQLALLGSFEAFLFAVMVAGLIQIALGCARAGALSAFFPSSVINGLVAAIGVILILKQFPHLVGHDKDPEGEMSFVQPDKENTFSELLGVFDDNHLAAALIGLASLALLFFWDGVKPLKKSLVPAPLVVVLLGVLGNLACGALGGAWSIEKTHLVQTPLVDWVALPWGLGQVFGGVQLPNALQWIRWPDFSQWSNPAVYQAGVTIAIVASLETLLNLEVVDKLDPRRRQSPPNRELWAQGVGNVLAGLVGALPVTSVVVRSSVNLNAGARTKASAIFHGVLLFGCALLLPTYLNMIPLSCLAAILLHTGIKLASPKLFWQSWREGLYQFIPFIVTLVAIVFTDLLVGILIGLGVSLAFILNSNLRRPLRRIVERHIGGDVWHFELPNQVSFLNRAALEHALREVPPGGHVLLDAIETDYIDPDILNLLRDYRDSVAPARGVRVSLTGFRPHYEMHDEIQYVDYSTRDLRDQLTPGQVLRVLREGNERFLAGQPLTRDFNRQVNATAAGQHPMAVVLSCIDSRTPAEIVFDLGLGDIFSVRVAGNVTGANLLGSMEYGCAVAGAKLVLVMGHTRCGAVTAAVNLAGSAKSPAEATGCQNLSPIIQEIHGSFDPAALARAQRLAHHPADSEEKRRFVDEVARQNVLHSARQVVEQSRTLRGLVEQGRVAVVGAMYDVRTGRIEFFADDALGLTPDDARVAFEPAAASGQTQNVVA